jgi:hypothetical protein
MYAIATASTPRQLLPAILRSWGFLAAAHLADSLVGNTDQLRKPSPKYRWRTGHGAQIAVLHSATIRELMDINMLAITRGQERTEVEFSELSSRAGLRLESVIATACPLSIVVAERAG